MAFERAHTADLNCVMCHRSINYVADMIEQKFGVPWIKVNFLGADRDRQIAPQDRGLLRGSRSWPSEWKR